MSSSPEARGTRGSRIKKQHRQAVRRHQDAEQAAGFFERQERRATLADVRASGAYGRRGVEHGSVLLSSSSSMSATMFLPRARWKQTVARGSRTATPAVVFVSLRTAMYDDAWVSPSANE